jgi:hypothetical protein
LRFGDTILSSRQPPFQPSTIGGTPSNEQENAAYCGVAFFDGRSGIWKVLLSESGMSASGRYPDTFFGVVGQRTKRAETPLELYDFWRECFRRESKERLLEVMAGVPDYETPKTLSQAQLASLHAERMTNAALSSENDQSRTIERPRDGDSLPVGSERS